MEDPADFPRWCVASVRLFQPAFNDRGLSFGAPAWDRTSLVPRPPTARPRLENVDILRGFALCALLLVHMIESFELYWADPRPGAVSHLVFLLFMGKAFSLLALCFGFSFFIIMDRAAKRGVDFTLRFAWRLAILLVIGYLHALIYRGDIIEVLAATGFLLILANRLPNNGLLIAIAGVCFLQPILMTEIVAGAWGAPWVDHATLAWPDEALKVYMNGSFTDLLRANVLQGQLPKFWFLLASGRISQIVGLFILGMVLGRVGFFSRPGEFAKARRIALLVACVAVLVLHFSKLWIAGFAWFGFGAGTDRAFEMLIESWFELAAAAVWGLLILAAYESPLRALVQPFAAVGRLTLSIYLAQSLIFVPVFYGFGLGKYQLWSQPVRLGVGILAVVVQLSLAAAWTRRFNYGPVEWLWRALTYMRLDIPFRRRLDAAPQPET